MCWVGEKDPAPWPREPEPEPAKRGPARGPHGSLLHLAWPGTRGLGDSGTRGGAVQHPRAPSPPPSSFAPEMYQPAGYLGNGADTCLTSHCPRRPTSHTGRRRALPVPPHAHRAFVCPPSLPRPPPHPEHRARPTGRLPFVSCLTRAFPTGSHLIVECTREKSKGRKTAPSRGEGGAAPEGRPGFLTQAIGGLLPHPCGRGAG